MEDQTMNKACLSATALPSVTLTSTSASPSETFRPGCNLFPLFNLFLNKIFSSEGLDCIKIIEELSDRVKRMVGMRNVVAITSAKVLTAISFFSNSEFSLSQVPIVKLIHQQCQIEADLSLYNVLARENTCLLSLYAGLTSLVLKRIKNVLDVWQPSF